MAFDKPIPNKKIFGPEKRPPFPMDQPEIPNVLMTVVIRLSSAQHIPTVEISLREDLPDLYFEENGNQITVSAYPPGPNFGEDNILAIVQRHDRHAVQI